MSTNIENLRKKISRAYDEKRHKEVIELAEELKNICNALTDDDYFYHGASLYFEEEHSEAIICFNKAIEIKPDNENYYLWRGNCHRKINEYADAEREYLRAIEKNERCLLAYNYLGHCHYERARYSQALVEYQKALEIEEKAFLHFNIGNCLIESDIDAALTAYTKAIRIDKEFIEAYVYRGHCYRKTSKYELAITEYIKALAIQQEDYNHYNTHNCLALCYMDFEKYPEALEQYNISLELDDSRVFVYVNRGDCYRAMKDHEKALADYQKALSINDQYSEAYNRIGMLHENEYKNDSEAINFYSKAIEFDSTNAVFYRNRAQCHVRLKNMSLALKDLEQAINVAPDNLEAHKLWMEIKEQEISSDIYKLVNDIKTKVIYSDTIVVHYTSLVVAKVLAEKNPFHLGHVAGMNDPEEGSLLWDWLNIRHEPQKPTFIACFAPNDDNLDMWRLYGKSEGAEAVGCSLTYDVDKLLKAEFKSLADKIPEVTLSAEGTSGDKQTLKEHTKIKAHKERSAQMYKVIYCEFDQTAANKQYEFYIENLGDDGRYQRLPLTKEFNKLERAVKKYRRDKIKNGELSERAIEKNIAQLLSPLRYLIKSENYATERECRLVVDYIPYGTKELIRSEGDPTKPEKPMRLHLELDVPNHAVTKLVIGPKVPNPAYCGAMFKNIHALNGNHDLEVATSICRYR